MWLSSPWLLPPKPRLLSRHGTQVFPLGLSEATSIWKYCLYSLGNIAANISAYAANLLSWLVIIPYLQCKG